MLFAQILAGYSLVQLVLAVIIVAGVVAICLVGLRAMGIALPGWVTQILGIVAVVVVVILAIRIVTGV